MTILRKTDKSSHGSCPVEFGTIASFTGGWVQKPMVLPTIRIQTVDMVRVGWREQWLRLMVFGHVKRGLHDGALKALLTELRTSLLKPVQEVRVRHALFDGAGESGSEEEGVVERRKASSKRCRKQVRTVQCDGVEFRMIDHFGILHVEALPAVFKMLLRVVQRALGPEGEQGDAATKKPSEAEVAGEPSDSGRLCWLFAMGRWQVNYQNEQGNRSSSRKGLAVPRTDDHGRVLAPEDRERLREESRVKAMKLWNHLDCSNAVRFRDDD